MSVLQRSISAEDAPRQAEAACADAGLRLKRWEGLERKLEEREKVLDAIAGRGEACWGNLHQAKVASRASRRTTHLT